MQSRSRSGKAIDDGHSANLIRVKVAQDVGPEALLRQLPGKHADKAAIPPSVVDDDEIGGLAFQGGEHRGVVQARLYLVPPGQVVPKVQDHLRVLADEIVEEESPGARLINVSNTLNVAGGDCMHTPRARGQMVDQRLILSGAPDVSGHIGRVRLRENDDVKAGWLNEGRALPHVSARQAERHRLVYGDLLHAGHLFELATEHLQRAYKLRPFPR